MQIRIAKKEENKQVIKFLNKVFHKPFPSLIPSLYGKGKNMMDYHFVVEEGDALVGAICAYPEDIHSCGITLNGMAIGMVATKNSARGKGVMTTMLNHVHKKYEESVDLMFLTGRRHRYEHFGYYPAGVRYVYNISEMSIKKYANGCPYSIVKAKTEGDFEEVNEMNKGAGVVVTRPLATESETLRNWFSKLYLIKEEGKTVGFIAGKFFGSHTLERIYIDNGTAEEYIWGVYAYKTFKKASVLKVDVLPTESELKRAMEACSEEYSTCSHEKYKVISYKRLIEKLLLISVAQNKLSNYSKVIEIIGREKLFVFIQDGVVKVEETVVEADITLTEAEAIATILGQGESLVSGMVKIALRHSDFI